jgi:hypothetical protein
LALNRHSKTPSTALAGCLSAGLVHGPGPQQGVDEDVQVLPQVVVGLDDVAAMAVDERREIRLGRAVTDQHIGSVFEVPDPEGVALIAGPAATDLLLADTQLQPRGSRPFQMTIAKCPKKTREPRYAE